MSELYSLVKYVDIVRTRHTRHDSVSGDECEEGCVMSMLQVYRSGICLITTVPSVFYMYLTHGNVTQIYVSTRLPSYYHTSQLVILTRATFRPHSCYWVIKYSCYRPIVRRFNQSLRSNQIRAYNGHSGCRWTFNSTCFQSACCMEVCSAVEACSAHNPEVRGSKPRSANSFCISLTDVKFKMTPKSRTRNLIGYSVYYRNQMNIHKIENILVDAGKVRHA
jgi:hypothetical protein